MSFTAGRIFYAFDLFLENLPHPLTNNDFEVHIGAHNQTFLVQVLQIIFGKQYNKGHHNVWREQARFRKQVAK